jgi:hypothetical protein
VSGLSVGCGTLRARLVALVHRHDVLVDLVVDPPTPLGSVRLLADLTILARLSCALSKARVVPLAA